MSSTHRVDRTCDACKEAIPDGVGYVHLDVCGPVVKGQHRMESGDLCMKCADGFGVTACLPSVAEGTPEYPIAG